MATVRRPTPDILGAGRATVLDVVLAPHVDNATLDRAALRYDYAQIDPAVRDQVQAAAVDMMHAGQRMQESRLTVGQRLIEVKALLPHGQFEDWCDTEFGLSQSTAQNMMAAARVFDAKSPTVGLLSDSAMYMLASKSVPDAARTEVIAQAQATGKSPTKPEVKAAIAKHKPARTLPPLLPAPPAPIIRNGYAPAPATSNAAYAASAGLTFDAEAPAAAVTVIDVVSSAPAPASERARLHSVLQAALNVMPDVRDMYPEAENLARACDASLRALLKRIDGGAR